MTAERDEAWFDALYRNWHASVLAYARRRVAEPDDLVSEVFTAAWRYRSRVTDPPLPWLLRTASNLSMHAARAERRRQRLHAKTAGSLVQEADHAEATLDRADASAVVLIALRTLSPADQELLSLIAWEQLSNTEVSFVLGCSEAAVRVRAHRARSRLERAICRLRPQSASTIHATTAEVNP